MFVAAEDVTDELRTKERLIQSERLAAIGRMAAHVTHEVRNPLSSIGLNVELLEEELANVEPRDQELLRAIHREIEHLTAITEEYLRVARLPNPQLEPEDLGRHRAQHRRVRARGVGGRRRRASSSTSPADLPLAALDEAQIRQVLINLLKNAREAMPERRPRARAGRAPTTAAWWSASPTKDRA